MYAFSVNSSNRIDIDQYLSLASNIYDDKFVWAMMENIAWALICIYKQRLLWRISDQIKTCIKYLKNGINMEGCIRLCNNLINRVYWWNTSLKPAAYYPNAWIFSQHKSIEGKSKFNEMVAIPN